VHAKMIIMYLMWLEARNKRSVNRITSTISLDLL